MRNHTKGIVASGIIGSIIGLALVAYPIKLTIDSIHNDIDGDTANLIAAFAAIGIGSLGSVVGASVGAATGLFGLLRANKSDEKITLVKVHNNENHSYTNF